MKGKIRANPRNSWLKFAQRGIQHRLSGISKRSQEKNPNGETHGDWKARESYQIPGLDECMEIFELAAPEKELEIFSENRLRRVRSEES